MNSTNRLRPWLLALAFLFSCLPDASAQQRTAKIPKAALDAMNNFTLAPGMKVSLFAAEPMLANPVAFTIDAKGRLLICETYRQEKGVEDNRDHESWVTDDLASQTVEDRLKLYQKHLRQGIKDYSKHQDRIRMLVDRDGNGKADISTVYVDGFDDPLEGTGAGILEHDGFVFYSCIPKLWAFRDTNNDGKADQRGVLSEGYGVRVAFRGHDLHGLNVGPDGRLYFTIGDRGLNVKTKNGRIKNIESGAVLRCELSGANLEIVATGLRNPQDLAFDDYGNLFTCDNNCDNGDRARWLHVVDGADYGWRMAFQYMAKSSPWFRERMWEPRHETQPAFILPPVENFADGPAGIAFYPGTGLPADYRGNFFLCDFRGTAEFSGVHTFKMRPHGGSFRLIDPEEFLWKCLATDVQFGNDGRLYLTDWIEGWTGTGKGRVYQVFHPEASQEKVVAESAQLLAADISRAKEDALARLLAHPNQRVRQRGQFELARRGKVDALAQVAQTSKIQFAKLHAVWGLGQIARSSEKAAPEALRELEALARDTDFHVRAAVLTIFGDTGYQPAAQRLIDGLKDPSLAVQREAAIALGKLGERKATASLIEFLARHNDADAVLRHAGVMGLVGCASEIDLRQLVDHENKAVRLGAVLTLRRRGSEEIARFLEDENEFIVEEAARGIYDTPIYNAYPALAKMVLTANASDVVLTRAANACLRLGTENHAKAVVLLARNDKKPVLARSEAMDVLANWVDTPVRDRITGMWRPIEGDKRSASSVKKVLKGQLLNLLQSNHEIRTRAATLAGKLNMTEAAGQLDELLWNEKRDAKERAGALLSLGDLKPKNLDATLAKALASDKERIRAAARIVLATNTPAAALPELKKAIASGDQLEKQSAIFMLSKLNNKDSDKILLSILRALEAGKVYPAVRLDILEAGRKRSGDNPLVKELMDKYVSKWDANDPLAPYRDALEGGDATRGEALFRERISLQCVRCHKVNGDGGNVGPDISKVAASKSRVEILESIVLPNKEIAKGYETIIADLDSGKTVSGILLKKSKEELTLRTTEDETLTIPVGSIEDIRKGKSSMPENLIDQLSSFDLRDLIEYLSQLK